jgi:anti-anti-sigma factor
MELQAHKERSALVITVKGRLDVASAPEYEKQLKEWIAGGDHSLIIDFSELEYISSAGLRGVLAIGRELNRCQGSQCFCGLRDSVRDVFAISGFDSIVAIYDSRDAAVAAGTP